MQFFSMFEILTEHIKTITSFLILKLNART